eukprot:127913-Pleurochrysis_carterae.AAC.2
MRDDDDDDGADFWAKAASRSFSHKSDEADAADVAEDAEFAYEWQCLAERSRQDAAEATKTADVSTGLAVLLDAGGPRESLKRAYACRPGLMSGWLVSSRHAIVTADIICKEPVRAGSSQLAGGQDSFETLLKCA